MYMQNSVLYVETTEKELSERIVSFWGTGTITEWVSLSLTKRRDDRLDDGSGSSGRLARCLFVTPMSMAGNYLARYSGGQTVLFAAMSRNTAPRTPRAPRCE